MNPDSLPDWLQWDVDLKPFNTLALPAKARYFTSPETLDQLRTVLSWAKAVAVDILPLGGGSNIVLAGDYHGLVVHIQLKGRQVFAVDDSSHVQVKAAAGENWHDFVCWTLEQGCYGLENLSLIPGSVGAAPIQNIGAYGVELKDVMQVLEAVNINTGELVQYDALSCRFGYRDSLFKGAGRDRFIIISVTFRLSRRFRPALGYGALQQKVEHAALKDGVAISAALVSEVVCRLRRSKLPDPVQLGNAGSFFKNPVVTEAHYWRLKRECSSLVAYPMDGHWKLAAGWLIDQCGFKGVTRSSGVGVYRHQALVLVNHGGACGQDILALADEIKAAVRTRFAIELEIEPRVYV